MTADLTHSAARSAAQALLDQHVIGRIWRRDVSVWAPSAGPVGQSIANRLGWLDVPTGLKPELDRVEALAEEVRRDGISKVYLLGMGGSSLCAEVMRAVYGVRDGYPQLIVMDTTDEAAITAALGSLDAKHTLFLVASKSGGTIEPASMERLFWQHVSSAVGAGAGRQFIAVTDPGTELARLAEERGYRKIFLNPPDIGGRFSALSLFGLVPGALIGAPVREMLGGGADMAEGCRQENHQNAGLTLGAFIGACAAEGRDKLTVALPPSLAALGLWIEQLVAESTGKHDKGALPVVDEPLGAPGDYGADRCFVAVSTDHDAPDAAKLSALETAGHPILRLSTRIAALGAEFFRWEFATAIAGAVLGINPFDEPNVSEAKEKTKAILATGDFSGGAPVASAAGISVFSSHFRGSTPAQVVRAALDTLGARDYVIFLSYLSNTPDVEASVASIRATIRSRWHVASTYGVGPRYLHSTGQYHKGGPNTLVAFVVTGEDATTTPIPGAPYTFAQLKRAQAVGDFQTLEAHGRRTVRIHFDRGVDPIAGLRQLFGSTAR
jgi:transaldolase/glucose-6-phosphate isomerase